MNKAFVKETDDVRASNPLPDRPIPSGPNYVTAKGIAQIEVMIALTEKEHTAARAANETNEIARTERDIRYWTAQRATAQLVDASPSGGKGEGRRDHLGIGAGSNHRNQVMVRLRILTGHAPGLARLSRCKSQCCISWAAV
jgi:hypothetical protein